MTVHVAVSVGAALGAPPNWCVRCCSLPRAGGGARRRGPARPMNTRPPLSLPRWRAGDTFLARLRTFSVLLRPLLAAGLWLLARTPAQACEGHAFVRAIADPLPAALHGINVEVYKTVAQQLAIDNPSARSVEVLDEHGVPFIRVGPAGVEGNAAAPAWYLGLSPGAIVPASLQPGAPALWRSVRKEPVVTWFDVRTDPARVRLAPEIMAAGKPVDVGGWEIPLRVDGVAVAFTGRFRYEPPAGAYEWRLTSGRTVAPGVEVTLLPGPAPGLLLRNGSDAVVQVYGESGEQFLRIGPGGVEANLNSPTWWRSARSTSQLPPLLDAGAPPRWARVGAAPRFSWVDPRAASPGSLPTDKGPRTWRVPVSVGDQRAELTGIGTWRAF